MIGKFEELVLLACIRTGAEALPSGVFEVMTKGASGVSFASLYTTLGRLEKKGFLRETTVVDAQGRNRRAFSVTGAGQSALSEALAATRELGGFSWGGPAHA